MAESLAAVRQAFDAWRLKSPLKGRPYPKSLRERALALPWEGDDAELSTALGLSHRKVLRNWRAQAKQPADGGDRGLRTPASFVEVGTVGGLRGALAVGGDPRVLEVALESSDGRCLRIRGALDSATVVGLAQVAFGFGGDESCCR